MKRKKLVVCDYPNPLNYTFPNFRMGSSENRLWEFAKETSELEEYDVIITGPLWLHRYVPKARHYKKRLNKENVSDFLNKFGQVDYLFAGHEYFDKDEYIYTFEKVSKASISYLLHHYDFKKKSFDGKNKFLFCYSDEMLKKYKQQSPYKLLLYHGGINERPYLKKKPKNYLVWIGRIDEDKSPHYAILASNKLNIPIYILGKTIYQPEYEEKYQKLLSLDNVTLKGVVTGSKKMKLISEALCGVYTCGPNYFEAGAGVLGEMLRSGIPIAGISWKGNDAVCEAVDRPELGAVAKINSEMNEDEVVNQLVLMIKKCLSLDRVEIFEIANKKYEMKRLIKEVFEIVDENRSRT